MTIIIFLLPMVTSPYTNGVIIINYFTKNKTLQLKQHYNTDDDEMYDFIKMYRQFSDFSLASWFISKTVRNYVILNSLVIFDRMNMVTLYNMKRLKYTIAVLKKFLLTRFLVQSKLICAVGMIVEKNLGNLNFPVLSLLLLHHSCPYFQMGTV